MSHVRGKVFVKAGDAQVIYSIKPSNLPIPDDVKGMGLFFERCNCNRGVLAEGTTVGLYTGPIVFVSQDYIDNLANSQYMIEIGSISLQGEERLIVVDGRNEEDNFVKYINEAGNPLDLPAYPNIKANVEFHTVNNRAYPEVVTLRDILPGEELLIDYGSGEDFVALNVTAEEKERIIEFLLNPVHSFNQGQDMGYDLEEKRERNERDTREWLRRIEDTLDYELLLLNFAS